MTEYYIPTGHSETELVEKRSRFIGQVWRVSSEEEARARIEETKKKRYDARHNCWCYRIREEGVERYSDDGEPQGTAGQPMLNVFQREDVTDVACVVTRYFGGVLLGAGGLVRAYTQSAKDALGDVMNQVKEIGGVKLLAAKLENVDMNGLRELGDQLKEKLGEGIVVLASAMDGKVSLMATATDGAQKKGAHAGNLIKAIAGLVGGGGGGRPGMAQAGGKNPAGMDAAMEKAAEVVAEQVK